jgi:hypothetical protein
LGGEEMKGYEVLKALNGFLVIKSKDPGVMHSGETPWIFETLEGVFKFLEERFKKDHANCGSCGGTGVLK